ncbi:DUF3570 domain-containing protein [Psychromonas sp.]|nr:DUF3570 domain-containing protein [Psychromonas sp.]
MSKKLLKSLNIAALALPAIASQASTIVDSVELGVRYTKYQEDSMSAADVSTGSLDRYDIDVMQFSFVAPLTDNIQLNLHYQEEDLSGASPWFTTKNADGEVVEVMSGATIEENRKDVIAQLTYAGSNFSVSGLVGISRENDYEANSFGTAVSYELPGKLTTIALAGDISFDKINPTPYEASNGTNTRVTDEEKESWSLHLSTSHVVNKSLIAQVGVGAINREGYLSDPYKLVNVPGTGLSGDSRPDTRFATTASGRIRYFIDSIDSAIHFDYRYYNDDWGINSHTFDIAEYFNIGYGFQLVPSLRYYTQSEAFFYENYYEQQRADGYYATDSRLSSFGAITLGLKVNWQTEHWFWTAGYQRYTSKNSYSLFDYSAESLSLVSFSMFTVGVDYKF